MLITSMNHSMVPQEIPLFYSPPHPVCCQTYWPTKDYIFCTDGLDFRRQKKGKCVFGILPFLVLG